MEDVVIRPPHTLHGQLQRGRGLAARRAAEKRGSGELVYDCVMRDPRWDHQVESRSLYYGRLIVDLEMPVGPIAEHLFAGVDHEDADEWRTSLAIEVLADLVRLTRREAAIPLRRYVVEGWNWDEALDALIDLDDPDLVDGLDELVLERCGDDELLWLLEPETRVGDAWSRRHPRIAHAVRARTTLLHRRPRGSVGRLRGESDAHLVDLARSGDRLSRSALMELGRRRNPIVLDLAEELLPLRLQGRGSGVLRALRDLGPIALGRARIWVAERRIYADVGYDVLASHGTEEDAPALREELAATMDRGDWGPAVELVYGLGRLRRRETLPLLRRAWEESPYDIVRRQVLTALHRIVPRETAPYALEGLWDCGPETRRRAARIVPLDDESRSRLRRLRGDEAEDDEVRAEARRRFEEVTPI